MATKTANAGLFRWLATDDIQTSISQVSGNFDVLEAKFNQEMVNIKDFGFGAVGNGTTNDAGALQKALNLAKSANASVRIFIPNGTYRMTAELKAYSNTTIICAPFAKIVRDHSGYLMMNGNRSTESEPSNAGGYTGRGNIHIAGGIWDGNAKNQSSKASIFHIGHADTIIFSGATLKDCSNSHHIEFNACQNIYVNQCKFLGWFGDAAGNFNEAIQLDLAKPDNTTVMPADNTPCKNVWIEDNYFGNSDTVGAKPCQRGVGSHSSTIQRWHSNVNINGNTFEDCETWAIRLYSTNNFTVSNNNILNCKHGINVRTPITTDTKDTINAGGTQTGGSQDCQNGLISGNSFAGGLVTGRGIELMGEESGKVKGVTVTGNQFNTPSGSNDAIWLSACDDCTVSGNRIQGAGQTGIFVKGNSYNITVVGNTANDCGEYGIAIENSYYVTVSANAIRRTNKSCVYFTGGEMIAITGNSLGGANGAGTGGSADATNNHIRGTSGTERVTITGNICRQLGSSYTTAHSVYITNTVKYAAVMGNVWAGAVTMNAINSSYSTANNVSG